MIQTVKSLGNWGVNTYRYHALYRAEIIKIKKKKDLWSSVVWSPSEQKDFQSIWGGVNVDDRWHRYYQYFTGKFDASYFPEILYSTILEPKLNPRGIAERMEDKAMLPITYGSVSGLHIPETVVANCSGLLYDKDHNLLTEGKALDIISEHLRNHGKAILKPTIGSCSGQGVELLCETPKSLRGSNWIIQELIHNQDDIAKLNASSINTFRVISYVVEDKICVAPVSLRMGVGNVHVDNAHAGGIFVGVNRDGSLCKQAYSEYGEKHDFHPSSHVRFEGYKIKGFEKLTEVAVDCHKLTPHLRIISLDLTLDKEGIPTLIEVNLFGQSVWFTQIAHGKGLFEENTEYMIKQLNYGRKETKRDGDRYVSV